MGQFLKEKNVKRDMSWKRSVLRKEKLEPFFGLGLHCLNVAFVERQVV